MTSPNETYDRWMERCLELARRGAGKVSPNPQVGCVILDAAGTLIGEGWHERFGGPHAEVHAVADVESRNRGDTLGSSTLLVNLEPCNHHGKTPPCTDLIISRRIPRVVVGSVDPNPLVSGGGIQRLRDAGVEVVEGVLEEKCARLNEAFIRLTKFGRPMVVVKIAQTLDGYVATTTGDSRWISGEDSRSRVHRMRAELDAVMVGSGTALADDPALTVRLSEGRQPRRIVLDREGMLPQELKLLSDEHAGNTTVFVRNGCNPPYAEALRTRGGTVVEVAERSGHLNLSAVFDVLGAGNDDLLPVQSVLVEAGPLLASAIIRSGMMDRLHVFVAPKILGDGRKSFQGLGVAALGDAVTFAETAWEQIGEDMLFSGFVRSTAELCGRRLVS